MTSLPRSLRLLRCSLPLSPSWRRSDVAHLVDGLDDMRCRLQAIERVEGGPAAESYVTCAREDVEDALAALHSLLRQLGQP